MRRVTLTVLLAATLFPTVGCGTHEPGGDCGRGDRQGDYYPLASGAWWYIEETDNTEATPIIEEKVVYACAQQVLPLRPNLNGFPLVRRTEDGYAYRWQEVRGDGVHRHYDETYLEDGTGLEIKYYCPSKLRIPYGLGVGNGRTESFVELVLESDGDQAAWQDCKALEVDEQTCEVTGNAGACQVSGPESFTKVWTLIEEGLEVSVPAGTFDSAHFTAEETDATDATELKHWYWSRGVGKVKESSENEDEEYEELQDFCIPIGPDPGDPPLYSDLPDKCPAAQ